MINMELKPKYLFCGDSALTVEFGNSIDEEINTLIRGFCAMLDTANIYGITEYVPTYRSVTIHYEAEKIEYESLIQALDAIMEHLYKVEIPAGEIMDVPVCYGGDLGPDLEYVAQYNHMTPKDVIRIHSAPTYLIYMLGFTPGFAYMGRMDERIATPRLTSPRTEIPAGSVGIAEKQTGIYPIASPGGWQLIGQTPYALFDAQREQPFLFSAGQRIRFVPIDRAEFDRLKKEAGQK